MSPQPVVVLHLTADDARLVASALEQVVPLMTDFRHAEEAERLRRVATLLRIELVYPKGRT